MRRRLSGVVVLSALALVLFGGSASSAPSRPLETINLNTLNIANALPLDLGVQKGFFSKRGIEIKKTVLQSGNDIVLALANNNGDIGYLGYVPAMIGRTQGIKFQMISASEVEGTSADDNWQNIMVKNNSSIRTPSDLAGKTIAVNALKGVGEVMIKAALKKVGVDPELAQARRHRLRRHAVCAQQRADRRLLGSRTVRVAGAQHRRRPNRDGPWPGARQVLADRRLRRAGQLDREEPPAREVLPRGDQRVADLRAELIPTRSARCCRRGRRTSACRSGARSSIATSSSNWRSTRRSSA